MFPNSVNVAVTSFSQNAPFTVGRGPVPRHAAVYRKLAGDRPPRYGIGTVAEPKNGRLPRRARACPSPCSGLPKTRGGQAPALREKTAPFTVGRGPVPRHAPVNQKPLLGPSDLNVYRKTCRALSRSVGP